MLFGSPSILLGGDICLTNGSDLLARMPHARLRDTRELRDAI